MGWSAYRQWIDRGRPFRLMTPAADLRDRLRAHGYTVYDIGNEDHMTHDPAEDHTPYSETSYPGRSVYGVGYAIDIMPPKRGQVSKLDGKPLPSLQQLGAQLVADRRAGVPGIKWLKYINWEPEQDNGGPCYHDSWQPNFARRSSSDRGHIHCSGLTGFESSTVARGYDPVQRIRGGDDHMERSEFLGHFRAAVLDPNIAPLLKAVGWQYVGGGIPEGMSTLKVFNSTYEAATQTLARVAALETVVNSLAEVIKAGGGDVDVAALSAKIDAAVASTVAEIRDAVADLGEGGAEQVRADAPSGT